MSGYVEKIVSALLALPAPGGELTLNEVADAVGALPVSAQDIEVVFDALERAGRHVVAPAGGNGVEHLRRVLPAARRLRTELGRSPTILEIAAACGLPMDSVRHALALARVMGR